MLTRDLLHGLPARPRRILPPGGVLLLFSATLACTGCTNVLFDRLQLGLPERQVKRLLTDGQFQRTELGHAHIRTDPFGRTDALVLLLTPDGVLAGKLHATRAVHPAWLGQAEAVSYRLRAEIHPHGTGLDDVGPLDALRAVAEDVSAAGGPQVVREAHALVAAGLHRALERWSAAPAAPPFEPVLLDALDRVPAGGLATVGRDASGALLFAYTVGPPL